MFARGDKVSFSGSRDNLELDFNMSSAVADIVMTCVGVVAEVVNNGTHAVVHFRYAPNSFNAFVKVLLPVGCLK